MEYLIIHGVERKQPDWGFQDFWALKQDILLPVLDGLKERRDRGDLWITDHIGTPIREGARRRHRAGRWKPGDRQIRLQSDLHRRPEVL